MDRRGCVAGALCAGLLLGCVGGAGREPPSPVVAEVEGRTITLAELDARVKQTLFEARTRGDDGRTYELRSEVLDDWIADLAVETEAGRRGVEPETLLAELTPAVSQEEVQAFYEENEDQLPPGTTYDAVVEPIRRHLEQQNAQRAVASLVASARVAVRLAPPRVDVAASGPSKGPGDAPVTIVEFSDFQCSYCRRAVPIVEELLRRYPDEIRVVYRHLPLSSHPRARPAAEASACAGDQGRFWAFHDRIFAHQDALSDPDLRAHAEAIGLDLDAYDRCVSERTHRSRVDADAAAARAAGVASTPTFFVNGVRLVGAKPVEDFERLIEQELGAR